MDFKTLLKQLAELDRINKELADIDRIAEEKAREIWTPEKTETMTAALRLALDEII